MTSAMLLAAASAEAGSKAYPVCIPDICVV